MQFITTLQSHGIQGNLLGIPWAYGICSNITSRMSSGWTLNNATMQSVNDVYLGTAANFDYESSMWFVAASIVTYCPWNQLSTSGTGPIGGDQGFLA